jgi:hypothetical protein
MNTTKLGLILINVQFFWSKNLKYGGKDPLVFYKEFNIFTAYSDTEFDDSSSTCSSSSDSDDGGEFRPPPGALRTMKHSGGRVTGCNQKQQAASQNTTTMRLRSSPRKIMPVPTSVVAAHLRKSPRKINATINHQVSFPRFVHP